MQTFRLLALIAFVGVFFSSCEKLELEDHCPEEQTGPTWNPGDLKVNDDSDNEFNRFDDSSLQDNVFGDGSDSSDNSDDKPSDDLVNDDSDNEDENQSGRKSGAAANAVNSSLPGLRK
jgi:hypothetical protein